MVAKDLCHREKIVFSYKSLPPVATRRRREHLDDWMSLLYPQSFQIIVPEMATLTPSSHFQKAPYNLFRSRHPNPS